MLQTLPQSDLLCPKSRYTDEVIEHINSYIDNSNCETLSVDISNMNIIDSCKITTLCSTHHYIKYPDGKIIWKISSIEIEAFSKDLNLNNSVYVC